MVSKENLEKKREEFWATRIEGDPNVWLTIKSAIELEDPSMSETIIKAADLRMANGTLLSVVDYNGIPYQLPGFVIQDPVEFKVESIDPLSPESGYAHKSIKVRIRPMGSQLKELLLETNTASTIKELKALYFEQGGGEAAELRLFFSGKELQDGQALVQCGLEDDIVVQAALRVAPKAS